MKHQTDRKHKHATTQWAKSPKNSVKECDFVNSALKIQCHIGDFAHWDVGTSIHNSVVQRMSFSWASMEQNLHGVILIAGVQERTHYIVQLVHKLRKIVGIQCN